ncbi:MAG: hypothetical protein AT718_07465 [Vulcanisaeta sp. JCHS_4]|jgi:hypothetical protein|nr:MAG: hypothetical protein AT718_07465 [Vulcanisaeta sp. JCHS_4]
MQVIFVTWRNKRRMFEFSGGNTRTSFLYNLIKYVLKPENIVEYNLDDLETLTSRGIAGLARLLNTLSPSMSIFLREVRFQYINCNKIIRCVQSSDKDIVIILDHIRSVIMMSKCLEDLLRYRLKFIHISHDYSGEFPYTTRMLSPLNKKALNILSKINPITIVVSLRDKILYEENAKLSKVIVFPNIYPPVNEAFKPIRLPISKNNDELKIVIVKPIIDKKYAENIIKIVKMLQKYSEYSITIEIITSLKNSYINNIVNINKKTSEKIKIKISDNIPDRIEYIKHLSQNHLGLIELYGDRSSGSNVRKYDYAIASVVPAPYHLNVQGESLPHELAFLDIPDLISKIIQLTPNELHKYGIENMIYAYQLYEKHLNNIINELSKIKY